MTLLSPRGMILLGFVLVVVGFIVPFLMVIRIMRPSFLVAFLSYAASLAGVILGLIGAALYARERRR